MVSLGKWSTHGGETTSILVYSRVPVLLKYIVTPQKKYKFGKMWLEDSVKSMFGILLGLTYCYYMFFHSLNTYIYSFSVVKKNVC